MEALDKRQQVKEILLKNNRTVTWLQRKLRTNTDLYYLLSDKSMNFDVSIYESIIELFKKEGFIVNEDERVCVLAKQLLEVNSIINHSAYMLNSTVVEYIKDNILDFNEKRNLVNLLDKVEQDFIDEINKIRKTIEG